MKYEKMLDGIFGDDGLSFDSDGVISNWCFVFERRDEI